MEAPDEHLQLDKTSLYIKVLWIEKWNKIFFYHMSRAVGFTILACTVILAPASTALFTLNAFIASIFMLDESRQIKKEGLDYFSDLYNWLDLIGAAGVIISCVLLHQKPADEFYNDPSNNIFLILGIMLFGLRALTSLTIFEPYRVQVSLFKQCLIDMIYFMSILLLLIFIMSIVYGI